MAIRVKVKSDTKAWQRMKKNLLSGSQQAINIGFFEGSNYVPENDNLPVAAVAQYNEEGIGVPMRSFIRSGFMLNFNTQMYHGHFRVMMQQIAEGKSTFIKEYSKLGPIFKSDMQEVIQEWDTPPNSFKTIAEKGRDDPLVDTGVMHDSVSWRLGSKTD